MKPLASMGLLPQRTMGTGALSDMVGECEGATLWMEGREGGRRWAAAAAAAAMGRGMFRSLLAFQT